MLIRHLLSILLLPFTVTVVVPLWIARRYGVTLEVPQTLAGASAQVVGGLSLAVGATLFGTSLFWFATRGHGTLAPWDPPRHLVIGGPYRYVRNPMISGVIFLLIGEALVLRSSPHGAWAATFTLINLVYIPLFEEPQLEGRFGDEYRRYKDNVSRLLPRLRPWEP